MPKRKAEDQLLDPTPKKVAWGKDVEAHFHRDLFDQSTLDTYQTQYSESSP